ncbi:MAG: hypothetical protein M3R36_18075 [Bacteroidota bacterium]|nr:hypothetical protein [Bacteroidota bacterium]
MKKDTKDNNKIKSTKIIFKEKKIKSKLTAEDIEQNAGFLGTKGKLLKALMEEKKYEREL